MLSDQMILDLATVVDQLKTVCENDQDRRRLLLNVITMVCPLAVRPIVSAMPIQSRTASDEDGDEFVLRVVDAAVLAMENEAKEFCRQRAGRN